MLLLKRYHPGHGAPLRCRIPRELSATGTGVRLRSTSRIPHRTLELPPGGRDSVPFRPRTGKARNRQRRSRPAVGTELGGVGGGVLRLCATRRDRRSASMRPALPTSPSASISRWMESFWCARVNMPVAFDPGAGTGRPAGDIVGPFVCTVPCGGDRPYGYPGNRLYFRHHRRTQRRGDHSRQCARQHRAARKRNPKVSEVRTLCASRSLSEPAAFEPCVRTISGNFSAATDGRHRDLSGCPESRRSHSHHSARTNFRAGRGAAHAAIAEGESRARSGR